MTTKGNITLQISIIVTENKTETNRSGKPYQVLDITYKDLDYNKVAQKKLFSFGAQKDAYDSLITAAPGDFYNIAVTKNDKGYNDWIKVDQITEADVKQGGTKSMPTQGKPAPRSNFETPEERANRQILIVRQSSISSAVAMLTPGAKSAISIEEVLKTAKALEDYVFDVGPKPDKEVPNIVDLENDLV